MENIDSPLLISVLQYLLSGFVSAWIFYGLTSYPKPSPFERVIQALIFTFIIRVVAGVFDAFFEIQDSNFILSLILALALGFLLSYFANNDQCHRLLRHLKITKETSYSSQWFGTFSDNITYIVLHLKDQRRIYGWPKEWPTEPSQGHFLLQDACWLGEKDEEAVLLDDVEGVLIDSANVELVEFMKQVEETGDD